jgi:uncharacterized protein (DUF1501 family)
MNGSRRKFLKTAGLGVVALGLPPPFLLRAAAAEPGGRGKVLLVIFQRGGMDGLNAVIPFKDPAYYDLRPSIAIAEPAAGEGRGIDLDGFYALHPALAPLKDFYDRGRLAIVHAAGSPDNTRSHFGAQEAIELGAPGNKSMADGWLNRLAARESRSAPFRAVAVGPRTPRILAGPAPALTLSSIEEFRLRNAAAGAALQKLYAGSDDPLFRRGADNLFAALAQLRAVETKIPAGPAAYPAGRFALGLKQIARLIKADIGLEIAFHESDGWDTHVAEGGAVGQMANRLKESADGLAAFCRDLGDRMEDIVVITVSEFGRTARENGGGGTDHGHANVMFVLGGKVRGGRVYGSWPGLAPEALHENRDLALTTDYRAVCSEVLARHLSRSDTGNIFPGFRAAAPLRLI